MVEIKKELCTGCGLCVKDCISLNIELLEEEKGENSKKTASVKNDCFLCGHCVAVCPCGAISIPEYDMNDVEEHSDDKMACDPKTVLHNIKFRRSIRDFRAKEVEQSSLEMLLQAGRYTATAKNNQDCYFVFVKKELETVKSMVWNYIDALKVPNGERIARELLPYVAFNRRRKADPTDDYLFRNAPTVLFITSDWELDAGLAAQNIETMAVSLGLGVLYNGFLARIANANEELKKWLGIEGKKIKACMLIGYPNVKYIRTAPRKEANVIWK